MYENIALALFTLEDWQVYCFLIVLRICYILRYNSSNFFTGETRYSLAFEKAFSLLKGSISEESGNNNKRLILFLTDGAPTDRNKEQIFKTIKNRNLELNNSVIILTFGFGSADQTILKDIAKQETAKYGVPANTSVGDIKVILTQGGSNWP